MFSVIRYKDMLKYRLILFPLAAFTSVGLAVYAYLGSFTRMLADDYCSIYFANRLGLLRSIWYWYSNWSGRYTAFALDWLILKFWLGPYKLHYIIPIVIFLWLGFVTIILYLYLHKKGEYSFLFSLALAGLFLFTVLMLAPDIPQSLFWWNGMRSYALPLLVLTFCILVFEINKRYSKINLTTACGIGFILMIINGGMGETFVVAQTVFILFLIVCQILWLDRSKMELYILCSAFVGSICSLIILILAPGNAVRQALLPPPPNFIKLTSISLQAYGTFIQEFFLEPAKIAGLIGAVLVTMWIGGYYQENYVSTKAQLIPVSILGGVALSFVCFPPGVYGYSEFPPDRIMIIPVFFMMGGVFIGSFLTGSWLANRHLPLWQKMNWSIWIFILLVSYSAVQTSWNLYSGRRAYIDFAVKWDRVDTQILQAKANHLQAVNIPAMDNWAGLERPTDNAKYWPTACYSSYYGIQVFGPPYP
jgi:uncharacterized protein DUF6056